MDTLKIPSPKESLPEKTVVPDAVDGAPTVSRVLPVPDTVVTPAIAIADKVPGPFNWLKMPSFVVKKSKGARLIDALKLTPPVALSKTGGGVEKEND
jgi:hypothetical protein